MVIMGWLKEIIAGLKGGPAYDLTFVPSISAPDAGIDGIGQAVEVDSCYIELYLESLRLARARKFATRFHAVAYSFVTLSREGEERAQLAAVSKPEKLAELDKDSLEHVITISKQIMGATPFRGGPVSIELGLFSVKSGNVLTPLLDYVTRVSSTAGISFVGAIKPFLPLITEGMDLIAGQQQDTALEVGVETDLTLNSGCVMAIIDRPKGSIDIEKLSLDKDRELLLDGKILDCGYAVFSLRPTTEKSDFGEIPELKERYAAFISAINNGKIKDAQDALGAFRLATIASPDLINSDADRLVEKASQKYKKAFPPGGAATFETKGVQVQSLSEIGLYD
jgi:hypothetical protein